MRRATGAKGIDGYAHTAAIRNGLRTIAFVGTGPDLCYPKEHSELFEQICEHGMILSEYPPVTSAYPSHFPRSVNILVYTDRIAVYIKVAVLTVSWSRCGVS